MKELVKIVVTVPEPQAEAVRQAVGKAGGGTIGNYTYCSFSQKGIGRFLPGQDANPTIGAIGKPEEVSEERIEVTCEKSKVKQVANAIREAHPYEEMVLDIYPLISLD